MRTGFVAVIGRPNVGKSTLMNQLLGQKISIVTAKPHTTRHRILGIVTEADLQAIMLDTPGISMRPGTQLNRVMNQAATSAAADAHAAILVIEAMVWGQTETQLLQQLQDLGLPIMLVINKMDKVKPREKAMGFMVECAAKHDFAAIVPMSARRGENIDGVKDELKKILPEAEQMFPEDQVTDRTERFLCGEIIREKLMRSLHEEVPYGLTVEIEQFEREEKVARVGAVIWVERQGQKAIVIGKGGEQIRDIGIKARQDMEEMLDAKVFLKTFVKVKEDWRDDARMLKSLGYDEFNF